MELEGVGFEIVDMACSLPSRNLPSRLPPRSLPGCVNLGIVTTALKERKKKKVGIKTVQASHDLLLVCASSEVLEVVRSALVFTHRPLVEVYGTGQVAVILSTVFPKVDAPLLFTP